MRLVEKDFTPAAHNNDNHASGGLVRNFMDSASKLFQSIRYNPAKEAKKMNDAVQAALWDDEFNYPEIWPILKSNPNLQPPIVLGLVNEFRELNGKEPDWREVDTIISVRMPKLRADPAAWQTMYEKNDRSAEIEARARGKVVGARTVVPMQEYRLDKTS